MLADRLNNLGTETAFAVSTRGAEWGAKGNRIFPFHLGDINLPTPGNVVDAMNRAIADGKTGYSAAAGIASFARRWPTTSRCAAASAMGPATSSCNPAASR